MVARAGAPLWSTMIRQPRPSLGERLDTRFDDTCRKQRPVLVALHALELLAAGRYTSALRDLQNWRARLAPQKTE
jgi:hypothetical protein